MDSLIARGMMTFLRYGGTNCEDANAMRTPTAVSIFWPP